MTLRTLEPDDYPPIISVLNDWWGGRRMSDMLPRLFFEHFHDTSFLLEDAGVVSGFLAGFVSQTRPAEAYIHFVGVNPAARGGGIGRTLYEAFFKTVRTRGCVRVNAVTSTVNVNSIAFHIRMGFAPKASETRLANGTPYIADYDGPGEHRVVFGRQL